MTPPPLLFHALLRPAVLQILRATGYHAARPVVLDSVTELAAKYLYALCQATARHAVDNNLEGDAPGIVDVRMALQELGAVPPDDVSAEGRGGAVLGEILDDMLESNGMAALAGESGGDLAMTNGAAATAERERDREWAEDVRGVEEFVKWFSGPKNKAIREMAVGDGEIELGDYLNVLKKKHSKTGEDSKYHGTILGKGNDAGEVQVEGGDVPSIHTWQAKMRGPSTGAFVATSPRAKEESRPPSSGLSSVGDRLGDDRDSMDLS